MEKIITICTDFNPSKNLVISLKSMEYKQRCSITIINSVSVI